MTTPKYYAGIGSRSTPAGIQNLMTTLAARLEQEGWFLRSGGADGADSAFEQGVDNPAHKEIYLPGRYFNGRQAGNMGLIDTTKLPGFSKALETVDRYHPAPYRLTEFARKLMARNAMQVLGPELNFPSNFIVAFTPGGRLEGGTAQALRMAADLEIPVYNYGDPEQYQLLVDVETFVASICV